MIDVKKLEPLHIDTRGMITSLKENLNNISSVLLITSAKDAIRANHYHRKDTHWTYLLSGKFEYTEKSVKKNGKKISRIITPGEIVVSKPNMIHRMKFLKRSVMIVFTTEDRDRENYETDTVRVKSI